MTTTAIQPTDSALLDAWVPMPRYLLRCWVIKQIIRDLQPHDFIEIGAASGDMALWMANRGMGGIAVEISPDALRMLRVRVANQPALRVFSEDSRYLQAQTDLLLSMEVLEHIDDDRAALENWFNLLRPGGHMLLSVPAHRRLFSAEDEMAGHFRRYERSELREKIEAVGFGKPEILSYGFPLGLLLKRLRNLSAKHRLATDDRSRQQRTEASGIDRRRFLPLKWLLNDVCFAPFNRLQMPFVKFDWSDGYIAVARKPEST